MKRFQSTHGSRPPPPVYIELTARRSVITGLGEFALRSYTHHTNQRAPRVRGAPPPAPGV